MARSQILRYAGAVIALALLVAAVVAPVAPPPMGSTLVQPHNADVVAVQSGSWQEPGTWDGRMPQAGDRVYIPPGINVANHGVADALWIHVAGTLSICHCDQPKDARFNVHTIYVPMGGKIDFGDAANPYRGQCVVEFLPGPFLAGDTTQLSRGLICHGEFMACGVEKTPWAEVLDSDLPVGASSLKVAASGWKVGDKLIVTGTDSVLIGLDNSRNQHRYQSEFVTVTGIAGETVTFSPPLKYRHFKWRADLPFHVGNLTRNIVFRSRDPNTLSNRGHAMHMGSMMNDARWVAFEGMGRTDAMRPVTDPRWDAYGEMVLGSDANIRARYSDHFHRRGQLSQPAIRIGCVNDGLNFLSKWGQLIHDSVAHVLDGISLRYNGSGFATEEGQERGSMDRCLSAMNHGRGDVVLSSDGDFSHYGNGDFGTAGDGFWLQGGMVDVKGCVAADNSGRGFGLFNGPLNGYPRYVVPPHLEFPIEVNGTFLPVEYGGVASIPSGAVPQRVFDGNTAYMNKVSVQCWSTRPDAAGKIIWPPSLRASLTNTTLWGRGNCLHFEYARQIDVRGAKIVGDSEIHLEYGFQWNTINFHTPVAMRGHHVTLSGVEISSYSNKEVFPNPVPIESVGDDGIDPDHVVESSYPVNKVGY